ncbi:MAG: bifunctional enoyl-CoA hydratase/phosphate acetyltransferase [Rubrivivax sp.]|nr:bifunctional enoyl-CoA hydratase/phosphate acetyltransferase [Rubrivivax sp.]
MATPEPVKSAAAAAAPARPHLERLVALAGKRGPVPVAVAYPCDAASLEAAVLAAQARLIDPILVGPAERIRALAARNALDLDGCRLLDSTDDPRDAAALAAAQCRDGIAQALMKGSLHTDELLGAAVSRDARLRSERRASHVFVLDMPGLDRPLLITDCVVNIAPGLADKRDIAQSAIDLAHALGIACPKVAILSAVETVNPAIPSTLDAAALCKMADRKQIRGAVLDGPLAFDLAISADSARTKGIDSPVAGSPDILLVPNLEAGNIVYKQLIYMAQADCAGVVLGMHVPIILTSRSDSVPSRVASCALGVLAVQRKQPRPADAVRPDLDRLDLAVDLLPR